MILFFLILMFGVPFISTGFVCWVTDTWDYKTMFINYLWQFLFLGLIIAFAISLG